MWMSEIFILPTKFPERESLRDTIAKTSKSLTLTTAAQTLFDGNTHASIILPQVFELREQINRGVDQLIEQTPSVEILLDCTQAESHRDITGVFTKISKENKNRTINILVDLHTLSHQSLKKILSSVHARESYLVTLEDSNITVEFTRHSIKIAQKMHFKGVDFRFFMGSPDWFGNLIPLLKVHLGAELRLSRFEDFGYKQVTHLELDGFGIRFEVWANSHQQPWYNLEDSGWIAAKFSRQASQTPTLNVLPSNVCNARCPYCVSDILGRKSSQITPMNYPALNLAAEFVKRRGGQLANISGGGEPTLAPNLAESVSILRQHFDEVILHTNGSRLLVPYSSGQNLLQALASVGLTGISLHRMATDDAENFSIMNLAESYVISDVIACAHSLGLRVQLSCVLLKEHTGTILAIKRFLEWVANIRADSVVFRALLDKLPDNAKSKTAVINYCNAQRVPVSLVEDLGQRDSQMVFIKEEAWGECGMERFFHYTSPHGNKIGVRILHGAWHQREQTNAQVSGFVFRVRDNRWGLYAGWVTQSDQVL